MYSVESQQKLILPKKHSIQPVKKTEMTLEAVFYFFKFIYLFLINKQNIHHFHVLNLRWSIVLAHFSVSCVIIFLVTTTILYWWTGINKLPTIPHNNMNFKILQEQKSKMADEVVRYNNRMFNNHLQHQNYVKSWQCPSLMWNTVCTG